MGAVLIVDDERSIRVTVKAFLEDEGHQVYTAEDARSALAVMQDTAVDVVLTDIILHRSSGVDLLKSIKQIAPCVQVVMMTGEPTLETASESLRLGAFDYLQKPVSKNQIIKAIRAAFNTHQLQREKKRLEEENLKHTLLLERLVEERTLALAQSEAALRRRADELAILNNLSREVGATITLDATTGAGLGEIAGATGADIALLFLRDGDKLVRRGFLATSAGVGWKAGSCGQVQDCLCGQALHRDGPVYGDSAQCGSCSAPCECGEAGSFSFAALPLKSGAETLGVLGLLSASKKDFNSRGAFLDALANELSMGLKKSLLYEQLQHRASELQASLEQTRKTEAERLNLQLQLQQSQKMEAIGTLAGGIAHDFNNILGAVIGYAELAQNLVEKRSKAYNHLDEVLSAGMRAKQLVQQILTFSRATKHELAPIRLAPVAEEAIKLLRASLPATLEIRTNLSSQSAVIADPTKFHQVLMNLCTNAAHAMRKRGGVLDVCLSDFFLNSESTENNASVQPGPYVKLTVSDTGQGMSRHILDRIFDPFFTTKRKGEGTGLGLSVVHGIVKSFNGHITVRSRPGKGTCFELLLPAVCLEIDSISEQRPIPTGSERILLVDDERPLVDSLKQQLESLGYTVTGTTKPVEAREAFRANPSQCDLVITDLTMPQLPGDKLARALLQIRPDLPIILCTGFSESVDSKTLNAAGFPALLHKPVLKPQLAEAVRKALDYGKPSSTQPNDG